MLIECVYCFFKAYNNYYYAYFPIEDVKQYINQLSKLSIQNPNEKSQQMMERLYTKCAIHNQKENIRKHQNHRELANWIIRTLIMVAMVFVFWVVVWSSSPNIFNKNSLERTQEIMCEEEKEKEKTLPPRS